MICLKGVAVAHTIHKVNGVGFRQRNNATRNPSRLMTAMTDDLPTNSAERASAAFIKLSQRHLESERQLWVGRVHPQKRRRRSWRSFVRWSLSDKVPVLLHHRGDACSR